MSHGLGGASTIGPTGPTGPAGPTGPTGAAGGDPGLVLLATATPSNVASVDFESLIDATYDEYVVAALNIIPATDSVHFWLRTSTDNGANYDDGASDYHWQGLRSTNTTANSGAGDDKIVLSVSDEVGSAGNELGWSGRVHIIRPTVAQYAHVFWQGCYQADVGSPGALYGVIGTGMRRAAADVDAVRFLFASGDIESGEFKLYGVNKSL